jgi:hypothetical protein
LKNKINNKMIKKKEILKERRSKLDKKTNAIKYRRKKLK